MSKQLLSSLLFALEHQRNRIHKRRSDGVVFLDTYFGSMLRSQRIPQEMLDRFQVVDSNNSRNSIKVFMEELGRFLQKSDDPQETLKNFIEEFQDFMKDNFSQEDLEIARDLTDEIKYIILSPPDYLKPLTDDFENTGATESTTNFGLDDSASSWAQLGQDDSFSNLPELDDCWKRPEQREESIDIFSLNHHIQHSSAASDLVSSWGSLSITDAVSSWAELDIADLMA